MQYLKVKPDEMHIRKINYGNNKQRRWRKAVVNSILFQKRDLKMKKELFVFISRKTESTCFKKKSKLENQKMVKDKTETSSRKDFNIFLPMAITEEKFFKQYSNLNDDMILNHVKWRDATFRTMYEHRKRQIIRERISKQKTLLTVVPKPCIAKETQTSSKIIFNKSKVVEVEICEQNKVAKLQNKLSIFRDEPIEVNNKNTDISTLEEPSLFVNETVNKSTSEVDQFVKEQDIQKPIDDNVLICIQNVPDDDESVKESAVLKKTLPSPAVSPNKLSQFEENETTEQPVENDEQPMDLSIKRTVSDGNMLSGIESSNKFTSDVKEYKGGKHLRNKTTKQHETVFTELEVDNSFDKTVNVIQEDQNVTYETKTTYDEKVTYTEEITYEFIFVHHDKKELDNSVLQALLMKTQIDDQIDHI